MKTIIRIFLTLFVLAFLIGCNGGNDNDDGDQGPFGYTIFPDPWPTDLSAVYTSHVTDPADDLDIAPGGAPPYASPVDYPPVDVTDISMGVDGEFLYIRYDFAGALPDAPFAVAASGEVEQQTVEHQSISINFNSDDDLGTGAGGEGIDGIDIFFALVIEYGFETKVYANYGFPDGDIHHHQGQTIGELGPGGPGHDYVILRYKITDLGQYFPRGTTRDFGGWSEAESDLYHHFAFDPWVADSFDIPAE